MGNLLIWVSLVLMSNYFHGLCSLWSRLQTKFTLTWIFFSFLQALRRYQDWSILIIIALVIVVESKVFQIPSIGLTLRKFQSVPSQDSQACSWQFLRTLGAPSQIVSNMKFIVLSLPFPLIPRAIHLDSHNSRYHSHKSWPWIGWLASTLSKKILSIWSFKTTYFMSNFHKVTGFIWIRPQHEICRALSPLHFCVKHFPIL